MKTKNLPLIVGIALPIVFIVVISIVIFTPSLFVKPQHNFLYSMDANDYGYNQGYKNTYTVENGTLALQALPTPQNTAYTYTGDAPTLYLYDVKTDTSHEVSFASSTGLVLDPGPSSPDGYTVQYEYGNDGIFGLFGSNSDDSGYFISDGNAGKRLTGLAGSAYDTEGNFKLIGWIK